MSPDGLRTRLARPAPAPPTSSPFAPPVANGVLHEAAVLVPLVLRDAPTVLLTLRASTLARHAGQVAFPGGRVDPTDADAATAALREAHEEIGLDPAAVELAGALPSHTSGTGFHIVPVIGLIAPGQPLLPNPHEVAEIFELPLSVVLDPAAPWQERMQWQGRQREYWVWPHERHRIWGATAAILLNLARVLR